MDDALQIEMERVIDYAFQVEYISVCWSTIPLNTYIHILGSREQRELKKTLYATNNQQSKIQTEGAALILPLGRLELQFPMALKSHNSQPPKHPAFRNSKTFFSWFLADKGSVVHMHSHFWAFVLVLHCYQPSCHLQPQQI